MIHSPTRRSRRTAAVAPLVLTALLAMPTVGTVVGYSGTAFAQDQQRDPWQGMNRRVFAFNDTLDEWFLEPFAKGWRFVFREPVMVSIDNVAENLRTPVHLFNNLVQLKPVESFNVVQRALLNSTLGVAGIIDIATDIGIEAAPEDFGQTLAYWGVASGPYVVLPLLGPSTVRDSTGLLVDSPLLIWPFFVNSIFITVSYTAGVTVNTRALLLDEIAAAKEGALDYYSLARNAYLQRRDALIADREEGVYEDEDDPFDFDFEDDEEE